MQAQHAQAFGDVANTERVRQPDRRSHEGRPEPSLQRRLASIADGVIIAMIFIATVFLLFTMILVK